MEKVNDIPVHDIETRVVCSLAVGRYVRASERFNEATREFTKCCKDLRRAVGTNGRFVCNVNNQSYLVTSDRDGNFDVEPIQVL